MNTYVRMPVCGTRKLYSYVYNVIVVSCVGGGGEGRSFADESRLSRLFANSVSALTFDPELAINILLSALR